MRNSAVCAITIYGKILHKNGFITTKLQMLNYEHLSDFFKVFLNITDIIE